MWRGFLSSPTNSRCGLLTCRDTIAFWDGKCQRQEIQHVDGRNSTAVEVYSQKTSRWNLKNGKNRFLWQIIISAFRFYVKSWGYDDRCMKSINLWCHWSPNDFWKNTWEVPVRVSENWKTTTVLRILMQSQWPKSLHMYLSAWAIGTVRTSTETPLAK